MKVMTLELERVALEKVPLIEMSSLERGKSQERGLRSRVASRGAAWWCSWGQPSERNDRHIHVWLCRAGR